MPKNKSRGNVWSFRPRFINDNVAIHLSYLRKYGEYHITVETLNRPFVLPHRTSSCCLSSVHTICQAFRTSGNRSIRSNWPTFQSQSSRPISEKCSILQLRILATRSQRHVEAHARNYIDSRHPSLYSPFFLLLPCIHVEQ